MSTLRFLRWVFCSRVSRELHISTVRREVAERSWKRCGDGTRSQRDGTMEGSSQKHAGCLEIWKEAGEQVLVWSFQKECSPV
jgi:hypothetical protein